MIAERSMANISRSESQDWNKNIKMNVAVMETSFAVSLSKKREKLFTETNCRVCNLVSNKYKDSNEKVAVKYILDEILIGTAQLYQIIFESGKLLLRGSHCFLCNWFHISETERGNILSLSHKVEHQNLQIDSRSEI